MFCKLFALKWVPENLFLSSENLSNNFFQTYLVVAGHTGVGVYPESSKESDLHLSISQVAELQEVEYVKKKLFQE